jgi:DNA primase
VSEIRLLSIWFYRLLTLNFWQFSAHINFSQERLLVCMAKISESQIDEVRSAVNIVHYIGQYVTLKKAGLNYKGLCPFHTEKTPSFTVSPQKQIFHCFGCGKGGNIFTFIMEYEKLSFFETIRKAAEFAGILIRIEETREEETSYFQKLYNVNETAAEYYENNLYKPGHKNFLEYILNRKISRETIKKFRLGYASDSFEALIQTFKKKDINLNDAAELGLIQARESSEGYYDKFRHRIIFPFFNLRGNVIGFGGRRINEEHQPKYLNSAESAIYKKGELLYGLHAAINPIREKDFVVLVEGYFDLLRLADSGLRNVIASSGTAFTDEQCKLLRRYTKNIYIAYDGDSAGVKAAMRSAQIIERQELNAFIVSLPPEDDPDTFVLTNGLAAFENLIKQRVNPTEFRIDSFYTANPNPSIEQKDQFIHEVLESFAESGNPIKIGLYLHQLADRFQINEGLLLNQYNRSKKRFLTSKSSPKESEFPVRQSIISVRTASYKAESGLLSLLLLAAPEVRSEILPNLRHDLFENDEMVRIYELIVTELEESGNLDISKLMLDCQDDEQLRTIISELALIEQSEPLKFAEDCLFQLKKRQLDRRAHEISRLIKEETASPESEAHYAKELMNLRRELNTLELDRRKIKTNPPKETQK